MDRGVKLMELYAERFAEVEARRQELVLAEKLFSLPLTDYSEFLRVKGDFEAMQILYKLYRQQKIARENWSRTLWAQLHPLTLTDGIENFMKEFRKIPKWVCCMLYCMLYVVRKVSYTSYTSGQYRHTLSFSQQLTSVLKTVIHDFMDTHRIPRFAPCPSASYSRRK